MPSASARSSGGAAFCVACGMLVVVGLAQVAVALWGIQKQKSAAAARDAAIIAAAKPAPSQTPVVSPAPVPAPPPLIEVAKAPEMIAPPPMRPQRVKTTLDKPSLDVPITDPLILEQLDRGLAARKKYDNQQALEAFRAAWKMAPDHPKLIYQLAETLDGMGLEGKAQPHWNSLISLGHGAGIYYELAEIRITNKGVITPGPSDDEEKEKRLTFADVTLERAPGAYHGDKKILKFTIKKKPEDPINTSDLSLSIYFFDLVNGRSIDITYQTQPLPVPESTVADWEQLGMERMRVVYDLGEMTPSQIVKFGQRNYYGYVLELYVPDPARPDSQGRLQDIVAEPAELANFAREMKLNAPPPPTATAPDSSLFPR